MIQIDQVRERCARQTPQERALMLGALAQEGISGMRLERWLVDEEKFSDDEFALVLGWVRGDFGFVDGMSRIVKRKPAAAVCLGVKPPDFVPSGVQYTKGQPAPARTSPPVPGKRGKDIPEPGEIREARRVEEMQRQLDADREKHVSRPLMGIFGRGK